MYLKKRIIEARFVYASFEQQKDSSVSQSQFEQTI